MLLRFTKMHGLGNDFMVIDGITQNINLDASQIRQLADRHFGIGFDQLLLVEAPDSPQVDFKYRIFNADGEEVNQCGNGARCFARFVLEQKLTSKKVIDVSTHCGVLRLVVDGAGWVQVNMGPPIFAPQDIPFQAQQQADIYEIEAQLGAETQVHAISAVSMGNPHCVLIVDNLDEAPIDSLGPVLQQHPRFPEQVNVGFMQVISAHQARLRVYERGVGETLACGSGACAAAVVAIQRGLMQSPVEMHLLGGSLEIRWTAGEDVLMQGPASKVFEGRILI